MCKYGLVVQPVCFGWAGLTGPWAGLTGGYVGNSMHTSPTGATGLTGGVMTEPVEIM